MRIRSFDCDFELINDFGTGEGDFRYSRLLDRWSVVGTITTREGSSVTANVRWRGTGRAETDTNTTLFPGFFGLFVSRRRDAVATGTVAVDGTTLVDGSTDNAEMETLEDLNLSWTSGADHPRSRNEGRPAREAGRPPLGFSRQAGRCGGGRRSARRRRR